MDIEDVVLILASILWIEGSRGEQQRAPAEARRSAASQPAASRLEFSR